MYVTLGQEEVVNIEKLRQSLINRAKRLKELFDKRLALEMRLMQEAEKDAAFWERRYEEGSKSVKELLATLGRIPYLLLLLVGTAILLPVVLPYILPKRET